MGFFVSFKCASCKYVEASIGVGHGRNPTPYLALFRCDRCKSIDGTWVHATAFRAAACATMKR
jgi:hypothetical protein